MEGDTAAAQKKNRKMLVTAAGVVTIIILALLVYGFIAGMGNTCNCGDMAKVIATTDGSTVIISYTGIYDNPYSWFPQRVPAEESRLTAIHYRVTPWGGTEIRQDYPAPGPGKDQTVRFEQAATPGKDSVIVIADYSDGSTQVVFDMYV
jgi:hypothetical protein